MNRVFACFLLWLQILQSSVFAKYVNPLEDCTTCPQTKYLINYFARNCTAFDKYNCQNCVMRFQCPPVIQQTLIDEGCSYLGKRYAIGEEIKTRNPCEVCHCAINLDGSSNKGVPQCASIECPEMVFGYPAKPENNDSEIFKHCYFKYSHGKCCGERTCPTDEEMKNITLCKYKNREYKSGERIYIDEDECKECICDENWNPEKPEVSGSCRPVGCSYSTDEEKKLMQGCTPIFEKGRCCPSEFICPENKRVSEPSTSVDQKHDQQMCEFDNVKYRLGEKLKTPNPCLNCTCLVPPLFTCIEERCPHQPCNGVYKEDVCCPINECENHKKEATREPLLTKMKDSCYPVLKQLYMDMNCTAIGSPNCPMGYMCPKLTDDELISGCFVDGKIFQPGTSIETRHPCTLLRCGDPQSDGHYPVIQTGGFIECPSFFRPPLPPELTSNQTCFYQYQDGGCCGKKKCLTENELATFKTCELEGKKYKLGEKMYPSETSCLNCLCTDDWKAELGTKNPSCKYIVCPPVRGLANRMQRGCAPVFQSDSCCVDDYYCPNEHEKHFNPFNCVHQGKEYNIGSELLLINKCITCNCTTPPLFSCEKMEDCTSVEKPPNYFAAPVALEENIKRLEYCEYNGKKYNISQDVDFPDDPCLKCMCGSISGISCTYAECPEMVFGFPAIPRGGENDPKFKNCYFKYDHDKCCGIRTCPTDEELVNEKKCVVNDKEYKLGQKVPSADKCKTCICSEDFDSANSSSSNGCRPIGCNNPHSVQMISRGCVPIHKEGECCPVDYHCEDGLQQDLTLLEAAVAQIGVDYKSEEMKCNFNGSKYSVGDKVKTNDICTSCSCLLPPMISCKRQHCEPPPNSNCVPIYISNTCCPKYDCPEANMTENRLNVPKNKCYYPKIVELYSTLGCKAETIDGGSCAYRFKCPNLNTLQSSPETGGCHYLGKQYKEGDEVEVADKCTHCRCLKTPGNDDARLTCVSAMCAPLVKSSDGNQSCYTSFEKEKCCGAVVCPEKIETCNYDGKTYQIGERIKLNQNFACMECLCTQGWNESNPELSSGCKPQQCMIHEDGNKMISNGCVPVYVENKCCPQDYFCPVKLESTDSSKKCVYRGRKYEIGSRLQLKSDVHCKCNTPPLFTCSLRKNP